MYSLEIKRAEAIMKVYADREISIRKVKSRAFITALDVLCVILANNFIEDQTAKTVTLSVLSVFGLKTLYDTIVNGLRAHLDKKMLDFAFSNGKNSIK